MALAADGGGAIVGPMKRRTLATIAVAALAAVAAVAAATQSHAGGKRPADVAMKLLPSSPDVYVVRRIVYTLLPTNVGGLDAENVVVDAYVGGDAEAAAFEVTQDRGTCELASDTHVHCTIDMIPHGKKVKIRIRVRPQLAGTINFTATTNAAWNESTDNDSASVDTPVHPGKPGTPKVANEDGPIGTASKPEQDDSIVHGRFGVSEPGHVEVHVVDLTDGHGVTLLPGSEIKSPPILDVAPPPGKDHEGEHKKVLDNPEPTIDVRVGDTNIAETAHPVYELHLSSDLRTDHSYAVVVQAKDLEDQTGNKQLNFKLKKK